MPYYQVRLHIPDTSACWSVRVAVDLYERLPHDEVLKRARALAVQTFGPDAATWTLLDSNRKR